MELLASMLSSAALLVIASSVDVVAQKIPEITSQRAPIDRYPIHQVTFESREVEAEWSQASADRVAGCQS